MASRPFNARGALRALELIGKHASVGAFKISEPTSGERKHISLELQQFIFNAICGADKKAMMAPSMTAGRVNQS
jgi:hypothetical protein